MPHFFQIILQEGEAMRQDKLWIPRKFMREYGYGLSKYVQVKDPNGTKWDLEWSKCDGDIWFKKRWEEFADYYSLRHGHLLVFKYEGNSQFSIVILDNTASEVTYPVATTHDNEEVEEVKEKTDQNQFFYDSSPRLPRKRKNSPANCSSRPPKKMKTSMTGKCSSSPPKKMKTSVKGSEGVFANQKRGRKGIIQDRSMLSVRKLEATQKIADFTSKYPYFACVMQPSYVSPKSDKLYLPFLFCKRYLNCPVEHKAQVLLYSNGKCWKMQFALEEKYYRARLDVGWGKFSKDNNLQVGDVCVFELISKDKFIFNVHIFPLNENPGDCSSSGKQKQVRQRKDAESETNRSHMQSNVPFFEVARDPSDKPLLVYKRKKPHEAN